MKNVIVAGSRTFSNYPFLKEKLDELRVEIGDFHVVSGKAAGADSLGERWARENRLEVIEFPADWRPNGGYWAEAGKIRNRKMAEGSDVLVAFWDGRSAGTQDMIAVARLRGLRVIVHRFVP